MKTKLKLGIYLVLVSTLIVTSSSCKKENDQIVEEKINEFSDEFVYKLTLTDQGVVKEKFTIEEFKSMSTTPRLSSRNNPNDKATGEFSTPYNTCEFAAIQNRGGIHGNTIWNGFGWGGTYGQLSTQCLIVEDNVAVVGSLLEEADNFFVPVGWYVYFRVIDNGEGSNAPADQIRNVLWGASFLDCDFFHPDSEYWMGTYFDLDVEGQIDVK